MTSSPHALGFKPPQLVTGPRELETNLKIASPFREVSPFEDERIGYYKDRVYKDHETLIGLGRRPTRKVLEKPTWKRPAWTAINEKYGLDGKVALDGKLMYRHWSKQSEYFDDELTRWKEFSLHQQNGENDLWLKLDFGASATDPRLANILVKLDDWREVQNYQQVKVDRYAWSTRRIMRNLEDLVRDETVSAEVDSRPNLQYLTDRSLNGFFELQMALESSDTLLTWIEGQIPEILAETSATLEASTLLQRILRTEWEQQNYAFHQKLLSLEARPDRPVQAPDHSLGVTWRMCHWCLETTRLMKDLCEWRVFQK